MNKSVGEGNYDMTIMEGDAFDDDDDDFDDDDDDFDDEGDDDTEDVEYEEVK